MRAGEGLDRRLVERTDLASASRLHCLGPRGDIPSLLHDATVLLLTSDSEGLPNVVLEALASGLPVVATAVGDSAQILTPECGMLVGCDADQLAAAVLHVIANASDYRRAVEEYGPHITASHSLQDMAAKTVEVWKSSRHRVLNRSGASSRNARGVDGALVKYAHRGLLQPAGLVQAIAG